MKRTSDGREPASAAISRRHLLASASAACCSHRPWVSSNSDARRGTLKVGTYGGYFKDLRRAHLPAFTQETGSRSIDRRADRRGVARPAADRRARQHRPGRRLDDGAGHAHQGPERRALGAARRGEAAQHQESRAALRAALSGRPGERDRRGVLVHHAGTNTEVYPEPPTSWKALWDPANAEARACWRWSATRSCSRSRPRPGSAAPTSWTPRRAFSRCWTSSPR